MRRYAYRSTLVVLLCLGMLLSCREVPKQPPPSEPNLAGTWTLVQPAGFRYAAPIEYMGKHRYRIALDVNMGGVYALSEGRLSMLNPTNDGTRHYVWKIEGKDSLLLIEAPSSSEVGSDYQGAVLNR